MQDEELAVIDRPAGVGRTLLASAIGLIYFSPVIWMVLAAFKTRADALATPPKLFFTPTLEHFWASFHRMSADGTRVMDTGLVKNFGNSIAISLVSVSLALALGALAAGDQRTVAPRGRVHCRREHAKWLRADELSEIRMGRYPAGHFPLLRYAEAAQMPFHDPPHRQI